MERTTMNPKTKNNYEKERIYYEQAVDFDDSFGSVSFAALFDYFLHKQKNEKKYSSSTFYYYWRRPTSLSSHR